MMSKNNHINGENLKETIRSLLNSDKVKLWLEPYTSANDGSKHERPADLIKKYSETLNISEALVEEILEQLRTHSVLKLSAKKKYQDSDIATLFIRLTQASTTSPDSSMKTEEQPIETSLYSPVSDVKRIISEKFKVPPEKLKLIALGRCLTDNWTLHDYNIKNLGKILAICLSDDEEKMMTDDMMSSADKEEKIEKTKKATEMLVNDDMESDNYSLTVADQNGKSFDLPIAERKALAVAMMLHEKGKTSIKKKNYGLAIVYLLEADVEFSKCTSQLLEMVDNYALLCLDIVWCYFMLQQVDALPDAERRLLVGEQKLAKSYGADLERVKRVRGNSSQEVAVMVRLHLMHGVLCFYKGEHNKSRTLLAQAESELKSMQVDKEDMMTVMEMGYTEQEARLALRFCRGNVSQAIEHIMLQRQEKRKIDEEEKEKKMRKKMAKVLGKTNNGQIVDASLYKNLTSMGFNKGATLEALKVHDNDFMMAIEFLQTHPDLRLPDPDPPRDKKFKLKITDEMIAQLAALGFEPQVCRATLQHFKGSLEEASAELLNLCGNIPKEWIDEMAKNAIGGAGNGGMVVEENSDEESSSDTSSSRSRENEEMNKFVREEIVDDFNDQQETDYLDLTLEEEGNILQEFKAKLASILDV